MSKKKEGFLEKLKKHDIKKNIINSFAGVKRTDFFDPFFNKKINELDSIPIGNGEKSDDPVTLAKMIQILSPKKKWRVLEVGTGSGYSTAILASMVSEVITIDYHEALGNAARERFIQNGIINVKSYSGDASSISEQFGEFDGVIIFAACIHRPFSLINTLKDKGVIVYPMGPPFRQQITLYEKSSPDDPETGINNFKFYDFCTFDSIKGKFGWLHQPEPSTSEPSSGL